MSVDMPVKPVEWMVQQGLFDSPERAILELAQNYVLEQIQRFQGIIAELEAKYGMSYQQFSRYLAQRADLLESGTLSPEQAQSLGRAVMDEEEDALEWKIAREMLQSWLGLRYEVNR